MIPFYAIYRRFFLKLYSTSYDVVIYSVTNSRSQVMRVWYVSSQSCWQKSLVNGVYCTKINGRLFRDSSAIFSVSLVGRAEPPLRPRSLETLLSPDASRRQEKLLRKNLFSYKTLWLKKRSFITPCSSRAHPPTARSNGSTPISIGIPTSLPWISSSDPIQSV